MEELKPCPFCPSGKGVAFKDNYDKYGVYCNNCNTLTGVELECGVELEDGWRAIFKTAAEAVTAWNTRPDSWINFATENIDGQETYVNIPNDRQEILVSDGETVWQDTFYNDGDEGCYLDNGREIVPNFTHWMPLPEPPKGDEN